MSLSGAQAEMDFFYDNTFIVVEKAPKDGMMERLFFEEDGRVTTDTDIAGEWMVDTGKICITLTGIPDTSMQDMLCADAGKMEKMKAGEMMPLVAESGAELMVEIREGR